jgi:hypothetical protein
MTNTTDYRTQTDAERDARTAIWGDVPFAKRAYVGYRHDGKGDPLGVVTYLPPHGYPVIAVTATVNGRAVVFYFDGYGRRDRKPEVAR